jgi:hypothetical protein
MALDGGLLEECLDYSPVTTPENVLMTLGPQVQNVVPTEYFFHKGDSSVYIELSRN